MTPWHVNVNTAVYSAHVFLFVLAAIDYENIFIMKISRFPVDCYYWYARLYNVISVIVHACINYFPVGYI